MTDLRPHICVLVTALVALLALPAAASANGGVGMPDETEDSAEGFTVNAKRSVWLGKSVTLSGREPSGAKTLRIERRAPGGAWRSIKTVRSGSDGAFKLRWTPDAPGRFDIRAVLTSAGGSTEPATRASAARELLVFRPLRATWYGPGFFGRQTACGRTLEKDTKGVAHRTLPCGTKVALSYGGREVVAEVIDRGPFANGADYDLTQATTRELGMTGTSRIGALPLRNR